MIILQYQKPTMSGSLTTVMSKGCVDLHNAFERPGKQAPPHQTISCGRTTSSADWKRVTSVTNIDTAACLRFQTIKTICTYIHR